MSVTRLIFRLADSSGKEAETSLWLADTLNRNQRLAAANLLRSPLLALTSARLIDARFVIDVRFDDAGPPSPESDVRRRLIALFTDNDRIRSFAVPSPAALPIDAILPYSGIRLQRSSILLSPLLSALEDIAENTVDEKGRNFPSSFLIGGVTRL